MGGPQGAAEVGASPMGEGTMGECQEAASGFVFWVVGVAP